MTAEVAVLNSNGIALAADSAVTIGHEEGKIYTSADKLFQLSESSPVGIMVYGSAAFLGVPWETIIKCYRTKLGSRTFRKLDDYSKNFISFLKASRMFPATKQKDDVRSILFGFLWHIRKRFEDAVKEKYENDPGTKLSESDIKQMFTGSLRKEFEKTKKHKNLDGMSTRINETIKLKYKKDIAEVRQKVFENIPVSKTSERLIADIVGHLLTSERLRERDRVSGIVVAGFGEKEHFPNLIETMVYGMAADHLLRLKPHQVSITDSGQAIVVPLAQREMVYTFMNGIDMGFKDHIEKTTRELFYQMADIILQQVKGKYAVFGKELQVKVRTALDKLIPNLYYEWNKTRVEKYSDPVMENVASLPKDELGAMAESLVNLTKFKRRISRERETVGGPIDVAVITKGDGFVWMKRKHYFDAGLNPRFIARINKGRSL
jgi:hypothetical protein